eukprot:m.119359 g.119359  ORF g.119359 m.119359 type:complete len:190 (-) comp15587_c0_seq2:2227-2796(-)
MATASNLAYGFRVGQIGCALGAAGIAFSASSNGVGLLTLLSSAAGMFLVGMVITAAAAGFFLSQELVLKSEPSKLDAYKEAAVGAICLLAATSLAASWADALERDVAAPSAGVDTAVGLAYFAFYMCNFSAVTAYQKSHSDDDNKGTPANFGDDEVDEDEYESEASEDQEEESEEETEEEEDDDEIYEE